MNLNDRLTTFVLTSFTLIAIIIWFALPYPWTPFGQWLESFVRQVDYCTCFWPWWLFVIASITISFISSSIYHFLKQATMCRWIRPLFFNGMLILYHYLARWYFLSKGTCEDSTFSPWVWLMILVISIITSLLSHHATNRHK